MFDYSECLQGTVGRQLSNQALEDELCTQAAHMAVSECHLVLLVAEVDRRGSWGGPGLRSMAHWLNWRCGTSLGAAREQVRVGRALLVLPMLRTAFASGELSYSKARAITRAATPETEASLVELAGYVTASQLEAVVREYRKASPDEGPKALESHRDRRYLRSWTDDEGMVVVQARLSPEDGAVVLAAIEAARQAKWRAQGTEPAPPASSRAELEVPAGTSSVVGEDSELVRADALVDVCEAAMGDGLGADGSTGPPVVVLAHVDQDVLDDPEAAGCSFVEGIGAISSHTARRLACSANVSTLLYCRDGRVEPGGKTRAVPRRVRRAVLARDRACRFPGCTQRRFVDVHHVVFWSQGGATVPSNLATLCRAHHRLVHEGGFHLEMDRSCHVRAWEPDGTEVLAAHPLPTPSGAPSPEQHAAAGLDLGPRTLSYGGESMDLDYVVDTLLLATATTCSNSSG